MNIGGIRLYSTVAFLFCFVYVKFKDMPFDKRDVWYYEIISFLSDLNALP